MYTVTVKSRKILEGKTVLKICAPLLVWMIAEFTTFLIAVKVEPLAIILYKDDIKPNVSYSEQDNEVYLDDMHDAGDV